VSHPAGAVWTLAPAVFVKTPGLSPLKTRLAAAIGKDAAAEFHRLSAAAVASVLTVAASEGVRGAEAATRIEPHWAVAEAEALGTWPGFPNVGQGAGELGARLAHVYDGMRRGGERVPVLLGADAPQLAPTTFASVTRALDDGATFVLGPAADGGFYLLAGTAAIPPELWERVPYSSPETAAVLTRELEALPTRSAEARVARLETLVDVDTAEDLAPLARALEALSSPTREQRALLRWLQDV
jgi:glycosyltransferase A (GT-A) superfamily protein (DUF2064 family)